ncbi:MAG TPA: hypothetical protein VFZ12_07275 [Dehalococcoidia bacterium]|nr:hypothetical protein [Dehalococcoidia bacterium]
MPLRDFVEKHVTQARERFEPMLRERYERMREARNPTPREEHYALPARETKTYRLYEADIIGTVDIGEGLELPVAAERGEIDLAKEYRGRVYKYSGKGTRTSGYSAALPDLVWPYFEEGRDVLLVEYGDSYVIFVTDV